MGKSQELKKAAADTASAAADYGAVALKEGLERAQHLLNEARDQAAPYLHDAKVRSASFASRRLDDIEPHLKDALDRVAPAVDAARGKVADDLLPKLQDALHHAAEHPALAEASKRGSAAVRALKGEVEPVRKPSKLKKVGKLLAVGAILAGAVAAVRHFLAPKDDGWTAHEPSKAYQNNNDTFSTAAKFAADTATTDEVAPDDEAKAEDMTSEGGPSATETEPIAQPGEVGAGVDGAPVEGDSVDSVEAEATEEKHYGDGSYVGDNPPEGFNIKGNERSKKYHVEGTGGYERTIAEVWFNSEEAAEAAGFTRAQR